MSSNDDTVQLSTINFPGRADEPLGRSTKLGFVGFRSNGVERLVAYYVDVPDLELLECAGATACLVTDSGHHCVVIEAGESRPARSLVCKSKGSWRTRIGGGPTPASPVIVARFRCLG